MVMGRSGHRVAAGIRWFAVAVTVSALVAGCAGIPTSGPVERVEDESGLGESTVRYTPAGPAPGASEQQIVTGFLDAMLAYPVTHRVAAQYLTPEAVRAWRPGDHTTVYTSADVFSTQRGRAWVDLDAESRLDAQGRLSHDTGSNRLDIDLEQIEGEWRIATPPDGVLVSSDWFDDYMRPFDLYFLDDDGERVVTVPVHEVVGDQLATSLMTSLAIGPGRLDPPGLTTAVPPTEDLRSSVPVVEGVAQVDFSTRVGDLSTENQKRLSAQIAWTLRQIPAVTDVQITGDGTVVAPNGDAIQDASGWASFGPDKSRRWAIAVADDVAQQVDRDSREPLPGAWGADAEGAAMVTTGGDRTAGVWTDRARVTDAAGRDPVEVSGSRFLRPVVDVEDLAWLIDRPGGAARVRVSDGATVVQVSAPGLPQVSSFSVSPDGARFAATADGALLVGEIERRDDEVVGLTRPSRIPTDEAARQVVWVQNARVAYLGPGDSQVQSVRIDGTGPVSGWPGGGQLLADVQPTALLSTAAPEADLYVLGADGSLWVLDRSRWVELGLDRVRGIA